jgi:hypothetical protein
MIDVDKQVAHMNLLNIEGRYPETLLPLPTAEEAQTTMQRAHEVWEWLISRL